jgi:hypothetical protein
VIVVEGDPKEAHFWIDRPAVYLDHWAVRLFSSDEERQRRFLATLDTKGTVLVSIANILEIAANTGQTADRIRDFLHAIGPRWFPISVNARSVADREETFQPRDNPPALGTVLVTDEQFRKRLEVGDTSLSALVDLTRDKQGGELLAAQAVDEASVIEGILYWRQEVSRDRTVLDQKWPPTAFQADRPTRAIYNALMRLCMKDTFVPDPNDVRDLLHAGVPMAYADLLLLDPHWAAQVAKIKRELKLVANRPLVFTKATVDGFLEAFEEFGVAETQALPRRVSLTR